MEEASEMVISRTFHQLVTAARPVGRSQSRDEPPTKLKLEVERGGRGAGGTPVAGTCDRNIQREP